MLELEGLLTEKCIVAIMNVLRVAFLIGLSLAVGILFLLLEVQDKDDIITVETIIDKVEYGNEVVFDIPRMRREENVEYFTEEEKIENIFSEAKMDRYYYESGYTDDAFDIDGYNADSDADCDYCDDDDECEYEPSIIRYSDSYDPDQSDNPDQSNIKVYDIKVKTVVPRITGNGINTTLLAGDVYHLIKDNGGDVVHSDKYFEVFGSMHPYVHNISMEDAKDAKYLMSLSDGKFVDTLLDRIKAKESVRNTDHCVHLLNTINFFVNIHDDSQASQIAREFAEGGMYRYDLDGNYLSRDYVTEHFIIPSTREYLPRYLVMSSGKVIKGFIADSDYLDTWVFHPCQEVIDRFHSISEGESIITGNVCWNIKKDPEHGDMKTASQGYHYL